MPLDTTRHPCFNDKVRHQFGRIHLPVAPACNVQCNFCDRKFDCANESRPGVTSVILSPHQALHYLKNAMKIDPRITVVGIAGPGDPFAADNAQATLETLRLVRAEFPEMLLCVASNGLEVAPHAQALADLKVSHVSITVNATDPTVGAKIYSWIREGNLACRGVEAAERLYKKQVEAITELKRFGVTVKINTIVIPGVNDHHIPDVAREMARLGADILNCIPLYRVPGTVFGNIEPPTADQMLALRAETGKYLPQMHHCTRCRADAAGVLGQDMSGAMAAALKEAASLPVKCDGARPYVAVASMEGMLVNQHLGEAAELWIYAREGDEYVLVEKRPTPEAGLGAVRWRRLGEVLPDCRAVLVSGAGVPPQKILESMGVLVHMAEGLIEEALDAVYSGVQVRRPRCGSGCGSGCGGGGTGCG